MGNLDLKRAEIDELVSSAFELLRQAVQLNDGNALFDGELQTLRDESYDHELVRPAWEPRIGALVKRHYDERRIRDKIFAEPDLFGEPAWDMLLDLARAETEGEWVSVTSACIASNSPTTTGLRWLQILQRKGYVFRENDALDSRRTFVRISDKGIRMLKKYFIEIRRKQLEC